MCRLFAGYNSISSPINKNRIVELKKKLHESKKMSEKMNTSSYIKKYMNKHGNYFFLKIFFICCSGFLSTFFGDFLSFLLQKIKFLNKRIQIKIVE